MSGQTFGFSRLSDASDLRFLKSISNLSKNILARKFEWFWEIPSVSRVGFNEHFSVIGNLGKTCHDRLCKFGLDNDITWNHGMSNFHIFSLDHDVHPVKVIFSMF